NSPQSLLNTTALEIQSGAADVVVLCGGETFRVRKRVRAAGIDLPWPVVDEDVKPQRMIGEELVMNHEIETSRKIWAPIQIYPMFETALRAASGRTLDEHMVHISELWSRFSHVAAGNPHAWLRTPLSPEEIRMLPVGGSVGGSCPRLVDHPAAHAYGRAAVRWRSVEQLRDACDRHRGWRIARTTDGEGTRMGQRRLRHQARFRRVFSRAVGARFPSRVSASANRRLAAPSASSDR
ncbi:MAG: hypothetical protein EBS20_08395, partial [Actinobacteria bacterium]|nr:hypothetical protein [Actinomycetota bacterium]